MSKVSTAWIEAQTEMAEERYASAHLFFKSVLAAITKEAIEHRFLLSGNDLDLMMDGVMDRLSYDSSIADAESVCSELRLEMRAMPHNAEELCSAASEEIFDAWRIKPIDGSAALMAALRPVAGNPATPAFDSSK